MKAIIAAALAAFGLSGCVDTEALAVAHAACARAKSAVAQASCDTEAENKYLPRHTDVMDYLQAKRLALAEEVDHGQKSFAQADAEFKAAKVNGDTVLSNRAAAAEASSPRTCNTYGGDGYSTTTCY
jgi:hypothetical protein